MITYLAGLISGVVLVWIIGIIIAYSQGSIDKMANHWHRTHPKRWPHLRK